MADEHDTRDPTGISAALARIRIDRRRVLGLLGAGAAGPAAAQPLRVDPGVLARLQPAPRAATRIKVVRPDDMVVLEFQLVNLRRTAGPHGDRLVRVRDGASAGLIVWHVPQAVQEEAFWKASGQQAPTIDKTGKVITAPGDDPSPLATPAQARLSGPSRVAFQMPSAETELPYTLDALLDACRRWPLGLDGNARPAPPEAVQMGSGALGRIGNVEAATAILTATLPSRSKAQINAAVDAASANVAAAMLSAARGGQTLDDAAVDALIAKELKAAQPATGPGGRATGPRLTPEQTVAVRGLVEASAVSTVGSQLIGLVAQPPHAPADDVTAIELPYRLIQSPLPGAGFDHQTAPVTHAGRIELWHTRLGALRATRAPGQAAVDDRAPQGVRALWTPDYPLPMPPDPVRPRWALERWDRRMLVENMAGYTSRTKDNKPFTPRPANAKRLMLSALGAWLDAEGAWKDRPQQSDLEAWKHKTAAARDYYVRVVYAGYLFPTGHAASLVKETERVFEPQSDGGWIAVLRQRAFIIVRERTRTYPGTHQKYAGNDLPFVQMDVLTEVTPDLMPPGDPAPGGSPPCKLDPGFYGSNPVRQAFWPTTPKGDVLFQMSALDGAGRRIGFSMPMMFVSELYNDIGAAQKIADHYNSAPQAGRRKRTLGGQTVQMAPPGADENQHDVHLPTATVTFHGRPATDATGLTLSAPKFYPSLEAAEVKLAAVEAMTGATGPRAVSFNQAFLDHTFDAGANAGQVFLDLIPAPGSGSSEKLAGLISPQLAPTALSRRFGAVGGKSGGGVGAATFVQGKFDPADFLPDDVKLLGAFKLKDILSAIELIEPDKVPRLANYELPDRIEARFELEQSNLKPAGDVFKPLAGSHFSLKSKTIAYRDGTAPQTTVDGSLEHFRINLFGCLILNFVRLNFSVHPGSKPDVNVDLDPDHGVEFGGALSFVNELRKFIPSNGFSDPPGLTVTPAGITAAYSLSLPPIAIGVLTLQNIMIGAGFNLPFTGGKPNARFNFAERQTPFNLTVSLFGGGGFFALGVDTDGVREVEAALEFGAQISIDLGVASGGVYVKGGFYYHWIDQGSTSRVELEAYVEMGGHLSVLGLITVSLTFHLGLDYEKDGVQSRLFGQATLTVEIEILFFSISVDVTVEREFAGSKDPLISDLTTADDYARYCAAFA